MRRNLVFHEGELPSDYQYTFGVALFNRPAFRMLQSASGWFSFYVLCPANRSVHAQLHFHVSERIARSPLRAPFASLEMAPGLPADLLFDFLGFAESRLRRAGVLEIVIKNPPDAYAPDTAGLLHPVLISHGYQIKDAEIGSVIPVSATPFEGLLRPKKGRKLRKSRASPARFFRLDSDAAQEVYGLIYKCRTAKEYKLSITFHDLEKAMEQFPQDYHLFGVYVEGSLVAASVTIDVNKTVLYHFISDHIRNIDSSYPALVLMEGIYNYCHEKNISMLDLGTSAAAGKPNFKLLNFKRELGALPTPKFTFIKTFSS